MNDLINKLKSKSIFLVPIGKLESWNPTLSQSLTENEDYSDKFVVNYKKEDSQKYLPELRSFLKEIAVHLNKGTDPDSHDPQPSSTETASMEELEKATSD